MSKAQRNSEKQAKDITLPDPVAFSHAMMEAYERAQPILEAFLQKQAQSGNDLNIDPMNISASYEKLAESFWQDPESFWDLQRDYWQKSMQLWQESSRRLMGEQPSAVITPDKGDRRFKAQEWQENTVFDFIKQSYLLTCEWMDKSVRGAQGLDETEKQKLAFSTQLFANALSPTNFAMTNPDVLKETMKTGGENLIRGFENLINDLERGGGSLKISTTNYNAFKLGENIATTPGAVVYQNDLIELIQYAPTTKEVHKRPLLIISPWINKYYILDLRAENSFIKWATEQGHSVFVISWVNPDKKLAKKTFEDYMQDGILAALDAIEDITGEADCNAIGYCLGGTLLTMTLAHLAAKKQDKRIANATFLTTLTDFEHAGDLKLFMDDAQLAMMDKMMEETGVLSAKHLQQTFSLLRANDLIWSFVINNYLMGKEPFPFDLLYWNDDSTNMPAATHSYYLRKLYRDNLLAQPDGITLCDTPINMGKIKTPAYFLSTREDHIAPWQATYAGTQLLGGDDVTFTLAASGHIAGVVNHPDKDKYCYWSANKTPKNPDDWLETADEHSGSWWTHWAKWIDTRSKASKVPARKIDPKRALTPAPGIYVKMKSD